MKLKILNIRKIYTKKLKILNIRRIYTKTLKILNIRKIYTKKSEIRIQKTKKGSIKIAELRQKRRIKESK